MFFLAHEARTEISEDITLERFVTQEFVICRQGCPLINIKAIHSIVHGVHSSITSGELGSEIDRMSVRSTTWWSKDTVAVVTGANKGIGYGIVRLLAEQGLTVVLTARDQSRGQAAIDNLKRAGQERVFFHELDVTSSQSVNTLATWLKTKFGGIDILVNNAGAQIAFGDAVTYEKAKELVDTNYYGVKNVTEGLLPLLRSSPAAARIVNTSSRRGLYERLKSETLLKTFRDEDNYSTELIDSLATKYLEDVKAGRWEEEGWINDKAQMYSESKIFMNAYAVALAKSLSKSQPEDHQILVGTFCPGFVHTDMLTRALPKDFKLPAGIKLSSPTEGADTGVWLALLPKADLLPKNGKFFAERKEYPFGWVNSPF